MKPLFVCLAVLLLTEFAGCSRIAGREAPAPAKTGAAPRPKSKKPAPDSGQGMPLPEQESGAVRSVVASYYGTGFQGNKTASGEKFNKHDLTAAHRTLPFGTRVRIKNPENGKEVVVRINDRGPHIKGREIDLSQKAAQLLDFHLDGVQEVEMEVLD